MNILSRVGLFTVSKLQRLLGRQPLPKKVLNPELTRPTYADRHQDQTFLVFGTGPSLVQRSDDIHNFIERYQPVTIGPNTIAEFISPDYHVFSSRHRLIDYGNTIDRSKSRVLISPYIPLPLIRRAYDGEFEYLMYRNDNETDFDIVDGIIQASCKSVTILSIGIAIVMGAKRVMVAGTDGFGGLAQSGQRLHYNTASQPKHAPGTGAFFQHYETAHRYHIRFLAQIRDYMISIGLEPFKIITPTEFREHYCDLSSYL